jgi:2,4-dienoyl-CoA reductase-like NADH-dependent reductase (Old Yellow Enzyme family)
VNLRTDRWGGSAANRNRIVIDILKGVRAACGEGFQIGLRLSPERFGIVLSECRDLAQQLMSEGLIDYLDMSLWDVRKAPLDEAFAGQSLISVFTGLDRGAVRLGVAGKVMARTDAEWCLEQGCDFVLIGRGAILHHDWPTLAAADPDFRPIALPVTREHLHREGLSDRFVTYMQAWKGFVAEEEAVGA